MKGINFEEWKALVKKNRQALNTKSNIYRTEPESLVWGGPGANKADEYLQMHTITYNVTGMDVPSDWPTEIMSTKTLSLSIPEGYKMVELSIDGTTLDNYEYENGVITVNNVQHDLHVELTVEQELQNNVLIYTAAAKLTETTSSKNGGIHTTAFPNILSHTFENGVGTIVFEENLTSFGNYAFYSAPITSITVSCGSFGSTPFGSFSFQNTSSLETITLKNCQQILEESVKQGFSNGFIFSGTKRGFKIIIPENCVTDSAFENEVSANGGTIQRI